MDGHIMHCGTTGSCQSAATSEIVKRCWSRVNSCKWRYSKCPDLYLYLKFSWRGNIWDAYGTGGQAVLWPLRVASTIALLGQDDCACFHCMQTRLLQLTAARYYRLIILAAAIRTEHCCPPDHGYTATGSYHSIEPSVLTTLLELISMFDVTRFVAGTYDIHYIQNRI